MQAMTAYHGDGQLGSESTARHLSAADRWGAMLAGLLVVLSFAFPIWGVSFESHGSQPALDLVAYITGFGAYGLPYASAQAALAAVHLRMGMVPPPDGAYPGSLVLTLALAGVAVLALVAAWKGRRARLIEAVLLLVAAVAGEAIVAGIWLYRLGHTLDPHALVRVSPFTPGLVGTNHIAGVVAVAGFRLGALWLVLAALTAVAALVHDRRLPG
jgi:copper chaperone NosL